MVFLYIITSIFTLVMISLFLKGSTNEYDKRIEDEEQMKWIQEYSRKKGEKYDKK